MGIIDAIGKLIVGAFLLIIGAAFLK